MLKVYQSIVIDINSLYKDSLNKLILPLADKILGISVQKRLKEWHRIQWMSAEELQKLQGERLTQILKHSIKNITYYKKYFKNSYPFIDSTIIKEFPLITKSTINNNYSEFLDPSGEKYSKDYTSGSSGEQGTFWFDREAFSKHFAIQKLWWNWAGYEYGDKILQTGISPKRGIIKSLKDWILRTKYINAFNIDTETKLEILSRLNHTEDYFFMGYASSIYDFAKTANQYNINDISFRNVISWGDKMFPEYRKLIENQFNTNVYDMYAACEGTMIASECEEHNYHIMTPHILIELLDTNGNEVNPGEIGEVVVTRFDNFLMPLIRYKIGDLAVMADPLKKCSCGRSFPMIEKIIGRDTDIIYTPKGKTLVVHFFTGIFAHYSEIDQFQVVSHYNQPLEIRYIPRSSFKKQLLDRLKNEIYEKSGETFPICFTQVNEIQPSASGKQQMIVKV